MGAFTAVVVVGVAATRGLAYAAIPLVLLGLAMTLLAGHPARLVRRLSMFRDGVLPVAIVLSSVISFDGQSSWNVVLVYGCAVAAAVATGIVMRRIEPAARRPRPAG